MGYDPIFYRVAGRKLVRMYGRREVFGSGRKVAIGATSHLLIRTVSDGEDGSD
jgi:hypothetical protein